MSVKQAVQHFNPGQKLSELNLKSSDYALDKIMPYFRFAADAGCSFHMSENDKAAGVEAALMADGLIEPCKFGKTSPSITPEGRKVLAMRERETNTIIKA